jgi:hypothetical protein
MVGKPYTMGKMEILMSPGYNFGIISCKGDNVADLLRHRIKIGVLLEVLVL